MPGVINHRFSEAVVNEQSSVLYEGQLVDDEGADITGAQVTALTLTLYTLDTAKAIINAVQDVNILNTGRGTVSVTGFLKVQLLPGDSPMVVAGRDVETHVLLLKITYLKVATVKSGSWTVSFPVYAVDYVP